MVIAGGEWQVPLICKAKDSGMRVININPYIDSPGFAFADIGLLADVLDKPRNLEYALQYQPDGVVTDQSDIAVPTVAYLCQELKLPGIGIGIAECFTNKYRMRQICLEHGFPTPDFLLCRENEEAHQFVRDHCLPVVVKPPSSQSSRGVSKVERIEELEDAFNRALSFSRDGTVLLEEFVGGTELTLDGIKTHQRHYCLATSAKTHYAHNAMVANQLVFSQTNPHIDYAALHTQHDALIEKMRLPFGVTHAEYKFHDGRFYLIEVAARGGGTRISSDIVPLMSGIDSNDLLIRMALGERIETIRPAFSEVVAVLDFLHFEPGRVRSITGYEEARNLPGVVAIGLNLEPGDVIKPPEDDRARHGYVIVHASTQVQLSALLQQVRDVVRVNYV